MLIMRGSSQHMFLPVGDETFEDGCLLTMRDGKVFPLRPGERMIGFAGSAYSGETEYSIGEPKIDVYFDGMLGTTFFDKTKTYKALDELFINEDCLLTNEKTRSCSEKMGLVTGTSMIEPWNKNRKVKVLDFYLKELVVLPMLPGKGKG